MSNDSFIDETVDCVGVRNYLEFGYLWLTQLLL